MSFKTLLLHLADDEAAQARRDTAVALARAFEAKLIGLALSAPETPLTLGDGAAMGDAWAEIAARADAQASARAAAFGQALEAAGISYEGRMVRAPGLAADAFALHARYADLSLIALPGAVNDEPAAEADLTAALRGALFESGRPLLALPSAGGLSEGEARDVVVAWDGRKEAARALRDALPLLRGADAVEICTVETLFGDTPEIGGSAEAAAEFLAAHGVSATANTLSRSFGVASALLGRVKERGSDMMVMGGYGHSRLSEAIFGGVTESLLRDSPVPIFMAH